MIKKYNEFRNLEKMCSHNDGTRSLFESALVPEVVNALELWKHGEVKGCILIGGMALSYYVKPRYTQDIDFLFLSDSDIPSELYGFKRTRPHAFKNIKTHVEVEVVTPSVINMREEIAEKIFNDYQTVDGINIISASGLIVSKLARFKRQDQADIESLIKTEIIDLSQYPLNDSEIKNYNSILFDIDEKYIIRNGERIGGYTSNGNHYVQVVKKTWSLYSEDDTLLIKGKINNDLDFNYIKSISL